MTLPWTLACSECDATLGPDGLPTVCDRCGAPWLVRYVDRPAAALRTAMAGRPWTMWRYREWLPVDNGEAPISLGEGGTPLIALPERAPGEGVGQLWVKDEALNPTGSFKARGLAAAVTRATAGGATAFTVPTAGNAGVALSAYGRRARRPVHVFAPRSTPPRIIEQMRRFNAQVELLDGHIGDCGKASRAFAAEHGAFDVSTLREPYRIEGKKTLGLEVAEQLGWSLPDVIVYPAGGGTGLIGMWIAFRELVAAGWVTGPVPRLYCVQSDGCAPVVRAVECGAETLEPWVRPETVASGLRVPAPLGGRLMLRAIRDTGGGAVAVPDEALVAAQCELTATEGIDACPEGGATLAALRMLVTHGTVGDGDSVVLFNTGAGWLYESR